MLLFLRILLFMAINVKKNINIDLLPIFRIVLQVIRFFPVRKLTRKLDKRGSFEMVSKKVTPNEL